MKIAIIGTGNVGGALATSWAAAGHQILLGVKDPDHFKGKELLRNPQTSAHPVQEAVREADVVLLAVPAPVTVEVTQSLGPTQGKVIIDSMNIVKGQGPQGFSNTTEAILAHTDTSEVVKCFNTTGYNNMVDPHYQGMSVDMFVAGDSVRGKEIAIRLARDAGFAQCYDVGGNEHFDLMEQFAWFWINLAMFRGQGREIAFKLLRRA